MPVRCVGSGVPGDHWEHGHEILPGTERQMFPTNPDGTGNTYFRKRCKRCTSGHGYKRRAQRKAHQTRRTHAKRMVAKSMAPDIKTAAAMMDDSGLTVTHLEQMFLNAIDKPCPGRCFRNDVDDVHVITEWSDLTLDWRDPDQPLTPENAGPLCMGCNQQKNTLTWSAFMANQHAIRRNFKHAGLIAWQPELDLGL